VTSGAAALGRDRSYPDMRIGLNLLGLTPRLSGGIELYAKHLVGALAGRDRRGMQVVLFCNAGNADVFRDMVGDRAGWSICRVPVGARPQALRVAAEQLALPVLAKRNGVDLLHSVSYTWPIATGCPGVVTVCDMLYAVWPGAVPPVKRLFWRLAVPLSVRRCRRTVTISHNAKNDITRLLGVSPDKVSVTYLAGCVVAPPGGIPPRLVQSTAAKYAPGMQRFVLSVGAIGRHKNPQTMIRALGLLKRHEEFRDVGLVVTGLDYGIRDEIAGLVQGLGLQESVSMPGHVPTSDLGALYAAASVYLSTSLMEGFGMTAVEAMSFGTPVVVGNRGALPEITGDGGIVVDALRPQEVADAVAGILSSREMATELSRSAKRRSAEFSWAKTADETCEVYRSILDGQVDVH